MKRETLIVALCLLLLPVVFIQCGNQGKKNSNVQQTVPDAVLKQKAFEFAVLSCLANSAQGEDSVKYYDQKGEKMQAEIRECCMKSEADSIAFISFVFKAQDTICGEEAIRRINEQKN